MTITDDRSTAGRNAAIFPDDQSRSAALYQRARRVLPSGNSRTTVFFKPYPTYMRSTGTGWAFGMGRFGSILGPVLGGQLIALGLPLGTLFTAAAAPILVSAGALFFLGRLSIVRNRAPGAAAELVPAPQTAPPLYPATPQGQAK